MERAKEIGTKDTGDWHLSVVRFVCLFLAQQPPSGPGSHHSLKSAAVRLMKLWVRIPPEHGYLSVVSVVCCQVEVSATN